MAVCQRLQLQPVAEQQQQQQDQQPLQEQEQQVFTCSACGIQRSTEESLEDHYYGNQSTKGCCWRVVEQTQRDSIANILETEASNQTHQVLRTVFLEALHPPDEDLSSTHIFSCFDILKLVTDKFNASQRLPSRSAPHHENDDDDDDDNDSHVDDITGMSALAETLQVRLTEPPLHINQFVIDSLRSRLVDRYADVPR